MRILNFYPVPKHDGKMQFAGLFDFLPELARRKIQLTHYLQQYKLHQVDAPLSFRCREAPFQARPISYFTRKTSSASVCPPPDGKASSTACVRRLLWPELDHCCGLRHYFPTPLSPSNYAWFPSNVGVLASQLTMTPFLSLPSQRRVRAPS